MLRRWVSRPPDAGFTLIEVMVAMMVIGLAMTGLVPLAVSSLDGLQVAHQRQTAVALADQAVEQVRALPFATVAAGLSGADVAAGTDPRITACGASTYCYGGERIPTGANSATVPLVPHQHDVTVAGTTYTVDVYVTYLDNQTASNEFRVTSVVSWPGFGRGPSARQVSDQTVFTSPNGCDSTQTHPFAAPCQPFFYGSTAAGGGALTVESEDQPPIPGITVDQAVLRLAHDFTNTQIEQVRRATAGATTSGASMIYSDGTPTASSGGAQVDVAVSDDPSASLPLYQHESLTQSSAPSLVATSGPETLSVSPGTADTGSATGAITAGQPSTSLCPNAAGAPETTGLPCANAVSQQGGNPASAQMTLAAGGVSLGPTTLASVAPPPAASTGAVTFHGTAGTTMCLAEPTQAPGCVDATTTRSLGTVDLAGLPAGLAGQDVPGGWQGYLVALTGYSDRASAEAGTGAGAPAAQVTGGSISYWTGSGYATMAPGSQPSTIPVAGLTIEDPASYGAVLKITMTASLSTGGTSVVDPAAGCASPCTRTQATATVGSPITGYINYTVSYGGQVLASVHMTVDLGSVQASATYQAAPSGA